MATDDDAKRKAQELIASLPPLEEVATPDVLRILERAKQEVDERGDDGVALEHLIYGIVLDPTGAEILRGAGAEVDAVARDLAYLMDLAARPGVERAGPIANCETVKKLAVARMKSTGATSVTVGELLAACFFVPSARAVVRLKKRGVTRVDVLRYLAHGITKTGRRTPLPRARLLKRHVDSSSRGRSECEVVLHNDDYTSVKFVIEMLQSVFDKSADDAAAIAKATHENQRSVIGRYEQKAAEKKLEKAHRRAEKAGFPLLLSIEPASGASS
jgi:ATP-dependent Clp protease adapter protein ClpS